MALDDQILLDSSPNLISICSRWSEKTQNLNWSSFCTYIYSNNERGFFCKLKPDKNEWRCKHHKNMISNDFEINMTELAKYSTFFKHYSGDLIDLNCLKIYKKDGSVGHFHCIDNDIYVQNSYE
jgi:hypothetical protein